MEEKLKLNIGSGSIGKGCVFADWVNVDTAYEKDKSEWQQSTYLTFDLAGSWPINYETVDCIFASHILEHFEAKQTFSILQQCYRVLKVGAPIRIICPDPRVFIRNWRIKNNVFLKDCLGEDYFNKYNYEKEPGIGFTDMFFGDRVAHSQITSIDAIMIMLIRLGFKKIEEVGCGVTSYPEYFRDPANEGNIKGTDFDNRPNLSWYLEGEK